MRIGTGPTTDTSGLNDRAKAIEEYFSEQWQNRKGAFVFFRNKIWESLLCYAGLSWSMYNRQLKRFVRLEPEDDYVPQPNYNRFAPAMDSVCSNFSRLPEIEARPKDVQNQDALILSVAKIATSLARHFVQSAALDAQFRADEDRSSEASQNFVLGGGFFTEIQKEQITVGERPNMVPQPGVQVTCPTCDINELAEAAPEPPVCPQCGGPLQVSPIDQMVPEMDEMGQPVMLPATEWRVKCQALSNLDVFPKPGATSMANCADLIVAQRLSCDEIWQRFGIQVEPDAERPESSVVGFEDELSMVFNGYSGLDPKKSDAALVQRMFIPPGKNRKFPDGLVALRVNNLVKKTDPWDYPEDPFTKFQYLAMPRSFFGRTCAFDLIPVQKSLNKYESIVELYAQCSAVDPIVIDENTIVTQITGRSDKVIKWRSIGPGSKEPHRMDHGQLDASVFKKLEECHNEFDVISGAVSVFRGQQPGSITAGVAIDKLKNQAEQMFSKPVYNWYNGWSETVRKGVKFIQKLYTAAQIADIVGPNRYTEIEAFKSADLDKIIEYAATTSGLPRTREERKQEMFQLFDAGVLDPTDVNIKSKVFELFGETGMMEDFNADATRARWENQAMMKGQPCRAMPEIEDVEVHYRIHRRQVVSLDFDKWDEQAKLVMMEHVQETYALLQMKKAMEEGTGEEEEGGENDEGPAPKPGHKSRKRTDKANGRDRSAEQPHGAAQNN